MVGTQSLGGQGCEAKRATQSQGCRGSKACRHSAPDVDRRHRIQLVIKGGCQSTCIAGQPKSRRSAGPNVPAGTLALVRSPLALRCFERAERASHIDPPASSYAIMQRASPYCGENPGPGKDVYGELDPTLGIREQPRSGSVLSRCPLDVRIAAA